MQAATRALALLSMTRLLVDGVRPTGTCRIRACCPLASGGKPARVQLRCCGAVRPAGGTS